MLNLVNFFSVSCILFKRLGGRERICEKSEVSVEPNGNQQHTFKIYEFAD